MTGGSARPYRKLPGHRRGFIKGSSVWLGADHLLLVKSTRFREEYKRFLLRDIQAIVVASMPRFAISTRAFSLGVLWLIVYFAARNRAPWAPAVLWTTALCLVGAWIYFCAASSCTCRIITAVSRDDLPSLYRNWTVRRFLAQVEPRIAQVQGVVEGNWAEEVEARHLGPPLANVAAPEGASAATPAPALNRKRTIATDIFVASLFAHALYTFLTLHSISNAAQWLGYGLAVVQLGLAIVIFFQYRRHILRSGMQTLAIVVLLAAGGGYYASQIIYGIATATSPGSQIVADPKVLATQPAYILLRQAEAAVAVALGIAGVVLSVMPNRQAERPRSIVG